GHAIAAAAVVRLLAMNLDATQTFHGLTQRLITVSAVAILMYAISRSCRVNETSVKPDSFLSFLTRHIYTWTGSLLLGLLAWYELRPAGVAVMWAVGGLVLLEVGLHRRSTDLRLQAYAAMLAAFARIFFVNFNAAGLPGEISPRVYTVIPIVLVLFYAYER